MPCTHGQTPLTIISSMRCVSPMTSGWYSASITACISATKAINSLKILQGERERGREREGEGEREGERKE